MLKARSSALAFALALATLPAGPMATGAAAAEPPASQEECVKGALALAEKAEATTGLAEGTLSRLEELLAKLEADCDAGRFPEAAATSAEIEGVLAGK
jgi:hypothetical protein